MLNLGFSSQKKANDAIDAIAMVVYFDPDDYKKQYNCNDSTFSAANIHTYCKPFRTRTRNAFFEVDDLKRGFRSKIIRDAFHRIIPSFNWEKDYKGDIIIKEEFKYSHKIDYGDVLSAYDEVLEELKNKLKVDNMVDISVATGD